MRIAAVSSAQVKSDGSSSLSLARRASNLPHDPNQRIIELVHNALLQWNDGIVGDVDVLRADLRATFRYIAKPDSQLILEQLRAREAIHRMHVQPGHAHKESRPAKLLIFVMISQDVA